MGSLLHPVGPEEPRVYWVRRGLVIAVLAALLVAVVWLPLPRPSVVAASPAVARAVPVAKASLMNSGLLSKVTRQAVMHLAAKWAQRKSMPQPVETEHEAPP